MKETINFFRLGIVILFMVLTTLVSGQMPEAITIEPANATVYDEITVTFDPVEACFQTGSLAGLPSIAMHSGVTVNGSIWQNVVNFDGTGANGQSPVLNSNPDGTFSIIFTPFDFYGFATGANVTQICAVFNNGTNWDQDGRDFQPGGTNCMDFFIPILPGIPTTPYLSGIIPAQGVQGTFINVNIFGVNTHFQNAGTVAWLSLLSDSIGFQSIYAVNDTLISGQLAIPYNAIAGFWNVNVANPLDDLMTLNGGFEIIEDTIPVYPFAVTISPENASAYDEITLTLDARLSCPEGTLFEADSVMMHSGVTIAGSPWQYVVSFDGIGANNQKPILTYNGDTTWTIVFTPQPFYGVSAGTYIEAINCVFNGGSWTAGEGKDYDDSGNCYDFIIPLVYATGIKNNPDSGLKIYPNPVSEYINIYVPGGINSVRITNCLGKDVENMGNVNTENLKINIGDLPSGVYFIKAKSEDGLEMTGKFIKTFNKCLFF